MAHLLTRRAFRIPGIVLTLLIVIAVVSPYTASAANIVITVDENGNGNLFNPASGNFIFPFTLQNDPGPGGLASALTYNMLNPPGLVGGDVILLETAGGPLSDVIRFNSGQNCGGIGCLVFYSDLGDGANALADIGFPTSFYENAVTFVELGNEGDNGFVYTPLPGQPGFVTGAAFAVTYVIKSDTPVPEPASLLLLPAGLIGIGIAGKKIRRKKS